MLGPEDLKRTERIDGIVGGASLGSIWPRSCGNSFYANKFEGRKTANGEIFSQKKLTGASNILPLNHWVRVTNTRNKLSVVIRITDRMHKNNKRLIDLSKAAAKKLNYTGYGLAHVKVEVFGKHLPEGIARD